MESFIVDVSDVAPLTSGADRSAADGTTRFLGRDGGPWVFYSERPAGSVVPSHQHRTDRTEFLLAGEIEFHFAEPPADGSPQVVTYGAGTMSFVTARTVYSYRVLQDAKILLMFDGEPGINYL